MPGGRRNPISVSKLVEVVGGAVSGVKTKVRERHGRTDSSDSVVSYENLYRSYVDITIQFIGASGLPKMDVVGTADPYFVAKLDDKISFVSTVKANTLAPVWNEVWSVKNVPSTVDLRVEVLDKDDGAPHDDYIGKFKTTVSPGAKEAEIEGAIFHRNRGTFWLKIESTASTDSSPHIHPFLFVGPIRFSRHFSPTIGRLTNMDSARLYSTWKMYLTDVPLYFEPGKVQPWNRDYKAAQSIFQGPTSIAVRSGIQAGHRMLYARNSGNGFGIIEGPGDVLELLRGRGGGGAKVACDDSNTSAGKFSDRIKPAVYTYILSAEDASFRFSETGAAFFVDFASKHALHAKCAPAVLYSGEFHPRPAVPGGWDGFSDTTRDEDVGWELVVDNNSGTYSPNPKMLQNLKGLLEKNFGFDGKGLGIVVLGHEEDALKESREACRRYAMKCRGVGQEQLQPHAGAGEETLSHKVGILGEDVQKLVHGAGAGEGT